MNLREAIRTAELEPDLDKALLPVQEVLGQTDGGPAGVFFSDYATDQWSEFEISKRHDILLEYVKFELMYLE